MEILRIQERILVVVDEAFRRRNPTGGWLKLGIFWRFHRKLEFTSKFTLGARLPLASFAPIAVVHCNYLTTASVLFLLRVETPGNPTWPAGSTIRCGITVTSYRTLLFIFFFRGRTCLVYAAYAIHSEKGAQLRYSDWAGKSR
jgi:hypothetical protein